MYDYWQDVLDEVIGPLQAKGITVVQIGAKEDKPYRGCFHAQGQTTIRQCAFLIRHSLGLFGADSFAAHLASHHDKPIVALYSSNYARNCRPYFNKTAPYICLEPDRTNRKPSFSAVENPKEINSIKPEKIVEAISTIFNFDKYNGPLYDKVNSVTTEFIGSLYHNFIIETVPNQVINPADFNCDAVISRMDYAFDETCLAEQLKVSKVCIATDQPIRAELLGFFRGNVKEVSYRIDSNGPARHEANFIDVLRQLSIPHQISCSLKGKELADMKLELLDYGLVSTHGDFHESEVQALKALNKPLFYKTGKFVLSQGEIFPSKAAWKAGRPVPNLDPAFYPIVDTLDLWQEIDFLRIVSRNA